jgi:hypothetical protein
LLLAGILALGAALPGCAPARDTDHSSPSQELFDEVWENRLVENPLFATAVGDHRFDSRLPSVTVEDQNRRATKAKRSTWRS